VERLGLDRGSYLDIGCGKGLALRAFRNAFPKWDIWGFEVSNRYKPLLEKYMEADKLILGAPHLLERATSQFEVISLFDVLEHVRDPVSVLRNATKLLKEGGYLYIQVPEIFEGHMDWLIADHLSHFSFDTIQRLAGICGLKVRSVVDHYSVGGLQMLCQKSKMISEDIMKKRLVNVYEINKATIKSHIRYWERYASKVHDVLREAAEMRKPFAVFGTGTAASVIPVYVAESLKWISCFIDENPHRIGKKHFDKPVVGLHHHPKEVDTIFLGIASQNIKFISPKFEGTGVRIVCVL
jgi:2-polyprenyl-3-methyl-5-hydroxy-6-metoxy-1,4-benzoquinol methylase